MIFVPAGPDDGQDDRGQYLEGSLVHVRSAVGISEPRLQIRIVPGQPMEESVPHGLILGRRSLSVDLFDGRRKGWGRGGRARPLMGKAAPCAVRVQHYPTAQGCGQLLQEATVWRALEIGRAHV